MNINQLESFCKAAQYKSFTKAAKELFISQPALSQQIRSLEEELGFPLFQRINKTIELTDAGTYFYKEARELIEKAEDMVVNARRIAEGNDSKLTVGVFRPFSKHYMPEILKTFNSKYKNYEIDLVLSTSNMNYASLLSGSVDLIFVEQSLVANDLKSITFEPLIKSKTGFLVRKDNRLSKKEELTWDDLRRSLVIVPKTKEVINTYELFVSDLKSVVPDAQIKSVSDFDTGISLMRSDPKYISIAPDLSYNDNSDLIYIPFKENYPLYYGAAYMTANKTDVMDKLIKSAKITVDKIYKRRLG